jgi:hypothetical protein
MPESLTSDVELHLSKIERMMGPGITGPENALIASMILSELQPDWPNFDLNPIGMDRAGDAAKDPFAD